MDPDTLVSAAAAAGAGKGGQKLVKRSGIAILLKNLPYEGDQDELRTMCEKFGVVSRFVLPDTKTIAVVEFLERTRAKRSRVWRTSGTNTSRFTWSGRRLGFL